VIAVFSAPLTEHNGKQRSLTDIALKIGQKAEEGNAVNIEELKKTISENTRICRQEIPR